jgi:hypothetical protein
MAEVYAEIPIAFEDMEISFGELSAISKYQDQACRDLWASVLNRAIKDAAGIVTVDLDELVEFYECTNREYIKLNTAEHRLFTDVYMKHVMEEALSWFNDSSEDVGSFKWICGQLDINEVAVRIGARALATRKQREFKSDYWE